MPLNDTERDRLLGAEPINDPIGDVIKNNNNLWFEKWTLLSKFRDQASELLDCEPDDLYLIKLGGDGTEWLMERSSPVRILSKEPLKCMNAPFVYHMPNRSHYSSSPRGFGVLLIEDISVKVRAVILTDWLIDPNYHVGVAHYLFVKAGEAFKTCRSMIRFIDKLDYDDVQPPLLEEGLLDSVTQNTIGVWRNVPKIEKYNAKVTRGILLAGPPGNGKTSLMRYLRYLCSRHPFIPHSIHTAGAIESYYSSGRLEEVFDTDGFMFFDDINVTNFMRHGDTNRNLCCAILAAMDPIRSKRHSIRIFSTNEPVENLDEAFLRPGRIDHIYHIELPDHRMRYKYISERWSEDIKKIIDIDEVSEKTEGWSFAFLESLRTNIVMRIVVDENESPITDVDDFLNMVKDRTHDLKKTVLGFAKK